MVYSDATEATTARAQPNRGAYNWRWLAKFDRISLFRPPIITHNRVNLLAAVQETNFRPNTPISISISRYTASAKCARAPTCGSRISIKVTFIWFTGHTAGGDYFALHSHRKWDPHTRAGKHIYGFIFPISTPSITSITYR